MKVSYLIIISMISYIFGALVKLKWDHLPNKFIPIQNVFIGLISAFICYFAKIETNLLDSIVFCLTATMSAGGTADFISMLKNEQEQKKNNTE